MIRYLRLFEVLELHRQTLKQSGGMPGLRDLGLLESAVAQPLMTFDGQELYPTLVEKAVALGFSLISNHPFMDGNKRTGHASMETFLILNQWEIYADADEQEKVILALAAGEIDRSSFSDWLNNHIQSLSLD